VVKSSKNIKVAFLKQEFVDDLVLERSLRDEFMSVFVDELAIMQRLKDIEKELDAAASDPDVSFPFEQRHGVQFLMLWCRVLDDSGWSSCCKSCRPSRTRPIASRCTASRPRLTRWEGPADHLQRRRDVPREVAY
jgi:hypothetical protein